MSDSLSVSVQTRINAPAEKAWQVLTDFGSYHTWHPILTLESHPGPLTGPAVPEVIGGQLPELHAAYETFAAAFKKYVEEGVS
jgi:hypothetical protein